jgi:Signal transduction histidine kinase regulating citrate/malate metabolism
MRFLPVRRPRSLAGQLFAMQAVLIAVLVAGYALFSYVSDRSQAEDAAGRQAMAVARSIADAPSVRDAIRTTNPTKDLQPYALQVQRDTGVDFVTIMNPQGIRWTHPDETLIGKHFLGHIGPALHGKSSRRRTRAASGRPSVPSPRSWTTATSSAWSARASGSRRSPSACRTR